MVGVEVFANAGVNARRPTAGRFNFRAFTRQPVHVGGWPTEVGNNPGESRRRVTDGFDFFDDGVFRAVLDDAPFMLGDGTKGASAKTAAHDRDRVLDHLKSGYFLILVGMMWQAAIGQPIDTVHFLGSQRDGWRIQPKFAVTMPLHECAGITGVGFQVQHAGGMGIQHRVGFDLREGRQANDAVIAVYFSGDAVEAND